MLTGDYYKREGKQKATHLRERESFQTKPRSYHHDLGPWFLIPIKEIELGGNFESKTLRRRFWFKMVTVEDHGLTSSHGHTEFVATYKTPSSGGKKT